MRPQRRKCWSTECAICHLLLAATLATCYCLWWLVLGSNTNMELARWFSYIYIYFTNKAGYLTLVTAMVSFPIVFTLYMYQGLVTKHMLYTLYTKHVNCPHTCIKHILFVHQACQDIWLFQQIKPFNGRKFLGTCFLEVSLPPYRHHHIKMIMVKMLISKYS